MSTTANPPTPQPRRRYDPRETIHTALITAFTIAAALIWKDVIETAIRTFLPESEALLFQFIAAVLATIIAIIGILLVLKTEEEVDVIIDEIDDVTHRLTGSYRTEKTALPTAATGVAAGASSKAVGKDGNHTLDLSDGGSDASS